MGVKFVQNIHYLFSIGKDRLVKYWDADKFELLLTLEGHHAEIWCLAVSNRGDFLVTGSHDLSMRCWDRSKEPFFLEVLGTDELNSYLKKYRIELSPNLASLVGRHSQKPWSKFINSENQHLAAPEVVDFMEKILRYDHQERPTAKEAMAHPYFYPIRNAESSRTPLGQ